jgi:hypothetical protein
VTITFAINVSVGTQGWLLNDLHFGQYAAARASCASRTIGDDGAFSPPRRATFFHRDRYQAFLDALRM